MTKKEIRICLKIQENEDAQPFGVCVSFGFVKDENFDERYNQFIKEVKIKDILKLIVLDEIYKENQCKIISPKEYDEKYGREE